MGMEYIEHHLCKNQSAYKNILLLLQARQHRKFAVEEGDHLTMLNVYEAFVKVSQFKGVWICWRDKHLGSSLQILEVLGVASSKLRTYPVYW